MPSSRIPAVNRNSSNDGSLTMAMGTVGALLGGACVGWAFGGRIVDTLLHN